MIEVKKNNERSKEVISFAESLLKDYEDLRSYVLESVYEFSRPPGLDLFLKKGFLKWMQVQQESEVYHKPEHKEEPIIKNTKFLPQDLQHEITLLLANMILEERSSNVSAQ